MGELQQTHGDSDIVFCISSVHYFNFLGSFISLCQPWPQPARGRFHGLTVLTQGNSLVFLQQCSLLAHSHPPHMQPSHTTECRGSIVGGVCLLQHRPTLPRIPGSRIASSVRGVQREAYKPLTHVYVKTRYIWHLSAPPKQVWALEWEP